jgi:addiction module RelE/StbE family toxin
MRARLSPEFIEKLKKVDARIRNSFYEKMETFEKSHLDPQLNNHALKDEYEGLRSINVTNDYRAIYEEVQEGDEMIAYFFLLGTHKELYE